MELKSLIKTGWLGQAKKELLIYHWQSIYNKNGLPWVNPESRMTESETKMAPFIFFDAIQQKGSWAETSISLLYRINKDSVNQHLTFPVSGTSPLTAKRLMSLLKHSGKLNKPKILLSRPFDLKNLGLSIIKKNWKSFLIFGNPREIWVSVLHVQWFA